VKRSLETCTPYEILAEIIAEIRDQGIPEGRYKEFILRFMAKVIPISSEVA